ncbi:NBS-LRR type resistance protein [Cucumis melo var. makuwa]|uniref:NBS-LRR type resistance protein n=1 Tax=Cucumis melo var. makuwa TaxID=1194695 RepID=A0A5D3CIP6_CUCMM|nr:NBS-LRR type resistance protein [Cucumis melo var. makuwa]
MWMNTFHMQATKNYSDNPPIISSSHPRNNFMKTDAMFLEFKDDLDNIVGGSSSVGDNAGSSSKNLQLRLLRNVRSPDSWSLSSTQAIGVCVRKTFLVHCLKWVDVGREYIEVVKGDLHTLQKVQRSGGGSCQPTKRIRWTSLGSALPLRPLYESSNHGRTRMLDRSNLTIIVAGPSRFYNDNTSSLREKGSRSIVWSCFEIHTFELGRSCRRPQRMRIIKCWNSNLSLLHRVVSHSLRMRYAIRCWVDDQATQKALVGDPSRRLVGQRVRAVPRHLVRTPHKKRLNYKLNLIKLWNRLKCKIEITKL